MSIEVEAELMLWSGADGSAAFIIIPHEVCAEIRMHAFENPRGFRSVRVECTIGEATWRTSVFPRKDGDYFLPVKADIRRREGLAIGDRIKLSLRLL